MTLARASALLDLGRPAEALQELANLGEDQDSGHAHCLRTLALLRLTRVQEAAASARQARALSPGDEWGYRLGAIAEMRSGRLRDAITLAEDAVRLAPDQAFTHQVAAITRLQIRDLPTARQHSEEMLRLASELALAHQTQGRVLMAQGLLPQAESALRQALRLEPQDAESMSLLADVAAARGNESEARDLRLGAVRADPQSAHRQQSLLRRGGAATTAGVLVAGKLGALKALVALNALRVLVTWGAATAVVALLALAVLVGSFVVSRARRRRHGRQLPPLVWEGLRPARRNADLLWVAWPAAIVALLSFLTLALGGPVAEALGILVVAVLVVAVCWRLRQGSARQTSLGEHLRQAARMVRFVVERRLARRRAARTQDDWVFADDDPVGEDRYPRAALFLALAVTAGALLGAVAGPWAFWAGAVVAAALLGAAFDGTDRVRRLMCCRVVLLDTTQKADRPRLALRAALRLILLPLLLVEVALAGGEPRRFLHDRLTGTEHAGLRPSVS